MGAADTGAGAGERREREREREREIEGGVHRWPSPHMEHTRDAPKGIPPEYIQPIQHIAPTI